MQIKFVKYQSIGNDFVLLNIENLHQLSVEAYPKLSKQICNRYTGVGSDGLIIVSDKKMIFLNPDGTYDVCGNGMRCVGDYLHSLIKESEFNITTDFGDVSVVIGKDRIIETIHPKVTDFSNKRLHQSSGWLVNSGTPHFCLIVDDFDNLDVEQLGARLEREVDPTQLVNIDFIKSEFESTSKDSLKVKIKIWERGVGQTLGCGTAAIAVSSVIHSIYPDKNRYSIVSDGGELQSVIGSTSLSLFGKVKRVFDGEFKFLD